MQISWIAECVRKLDQVLIPLKDLRESALYPGVFNENQLKIIVQNFKPYKVYSKKADRLLV